MPSKTILTIIWLTLAGSAAIAQERISARVTDIESGESLIFAHVQNLSADKGTVTNQEGYFSIVASRNDSVRISYLGYKSLNSTFGEIQNQLIELESDENLLQEIRIVSTSKTAFEILKQTQKTLQKNTEPQYGKAYLMINTTVDNEPIEFSQSFYSTIAYQGSLESLKFKSGQSYLSKMKNGRWFFNLDISKAFSMYSILQGNNLFPQNPFELSHRKVKKRFNLKVEESNSAYLRILFEPIEENSEYAKGEIWVHPQDFSLIKLILNGQDNKTIFLPMGGIDITNTDYTISYNYKERDDKNRLSHISINYKTTVTDDSTSSNVRSEAVLHIAKHNDSFFQPTLENASQISDYGLISLIPDTLIFTALKDKNQIALTSYQQANLDALKSEGHRFHGQIDGINDILKNNYLNWSPKTRILIDHTKKKLDGRNVKSIEDRISRSNITSDNMNIEASIYLDMTKNNDEMIVETCSLLDMQKSFNHLSPSTLLQVYANIYFDLTEVYRQKLESRIKENSLTQEDILLAYSEINTELSKKQKTLMKAGLNRNNNTALERWNTYILDELGIDNFEKFGLNKLAKTSK